MEDKKLDLLAQAKHIFEKLKTDDNGVLFTKEKITSRLFKKLKKNLFKRQGTCKSYNKR